tara:strand:- start:360 stop:638 length:279 start_codon:yes stop_codon:yes gene_type:complete
MVLKKITETQYPELIIRNYKEYDYKFQKKMFNNSDIVLIEISSHRIYHDSKNNIYQADYYSKSEQKDMNITTYKQTQEELIEDIKLIKKKNK